MRGDIIVGSRGGGDRICPNAPDEGTSCWVEQGEPIGSPSAEQGFALRLDPTGESEEQQIRFWEPEGRDSRRFAVGFIF